MAHVNVYCVSVRGRARLSCKCCHLPIEKGSHVQISFSDLIMSGCFGCLSVPWSILLLHMPFKPSLTVGLIVNIATLRKFT